MRLPALPSLTVAVLTILSLAARGEDTPNPAPAQKAEVAGQSATFSDAEAAKHIGEEATVSGKVVAVGTSRQGNIYLNFGASFPKQVFSGLIRSKDAQKVGDAKKWEGKTVAITGKIESYNDKPQIVISSPDQIKVIEHTAPAGTTAKP